MKLSSVIVLRPLCVFIILAFVVLLLPSLVIPYWYHKVRHIEHGVKLNSQNLRAELISQVENTANLLQPFNSSASNLARVLSSSLNGTKLPFQKIETRVAPMLFQALSVLPHLSQISYIGSDGLFYSYYIDDDDQTFAVYSNTSFVFNSSTTPNVTSNYTWYTQHVNGGTGKLYGEAIKSNPMIIVNSSWFPGALDSSNGYASLGHRWNSDRELVLLNSASMDMNGYKGVVSLGFSVKSLSKFFSDIDFYGGNLYLATKDGTLLLQGIPNTRMVVVDGDSISLQLLKPNGDLKGHIGNISCKPNDDGTVNSTIMKVLETKYLVHCSPLDILGVQSVYVMAFPRKGLVSLVHKNSKLALMVLVVMIITMVISIFTFVFIIIRAARREMHLCAALIKQMESTQQAERKHLNRSLAFASAAHDVRASLAGITGLIELSYHAAAPGSELETNLRQMETCNKDLLRLLNSILDTSKIEAGKMDLNEEEFNLAELLEDVVDMYHPVGMKKGVDVVLDPCDGSVLKFAQVKGDRAKLKQILWNLLSNAVKFTNEGHITVRALAKKPSLEQTIIASQHNGFLNNFSCLFFKNNEALETVKTVQHNPNTIEFLFEVEDTGAGVPKEKQKAVFDNYVQVNETAKGKGGTGLGLGIVQSLVRLMGGEIGIVDKENGENGTCFRFNAFLTTTNETAVSNDHHDEDDLEGQGGVSVLSLETNHQQQHAGFMSFRSPNLRFDGSSHVVLLIQSDERRRVIYKFMESLGIRVSVAKQWENLPHILKRIKRKLHLSHYSSSGKSDWSSKSERLSKSASQNSSVGAKEVPLSAMDGTDHALPIYRSRTNNTRGAQNFVLIVIDTTSGPFTELCKVMSDFRTDIKNASEGSFCCRVVWLDNPASRSIPLRGGGRFEGQEYLISSHDHATAKPFHGSRLYQVIRFLPEFGGTSPPRQHAFQEENYVVSAEPANSSTQPHHQLRRVRTRSQTPPITPRHGGEIQEDGSTTTSGGEETRSAKKVSFLKLASSNHPPRKHEVGDPGEEKPLNGKKVLVVEDNTVLRRVAVSALSRLGATVEFCENGKDALELVCQGLNDQRLLEASMILPYDYIFMDCEMPIMDGFEATRLIRREEKKYGVHTPIIALTAHTEGEGAKKMMQAGMDFHLSKPLRKERLLEVIVSINGN